MVEINNVFVSKVSDAADSEHSLQGTSEVCNHLHDLAKRDENKNDLDSSADMVFNLMQQFLQVFPKLGLQVNSHGIATDKNDKLMAVGEMHKADVLELTAQRRHAAEKRFSGQADTKTETVLATVSDAGASVFATQFSATGETTIIPELTAQRRHAAEKCFSGQADTNKETALVSISDTEASNSPAQVSTVGVTMMQVESNEYNDIGIKQTTERKDLTLLSTTVLRSDATPRVKSASAPMAPTSAGESGWQYSLLSWHTQHAVNSATKQVNAGENGFRYSLRSRDTPHIANIASNPVRTDENGLRYSFRSWGGQHAVNIVTAPGMSSQGLSSSSTLTLHPSSALVEQRLDVYGGMTDGGDRWMLREHGGEQRQQQHSDRHQHDQDEDNA